ncbi:MAG: hypothetical protein D6772_12185, partial [Bacteroidetes bacterium]
MVETQLTYAQVKAQHRELADNHCWILGILGIWGERLSNREIARVGRDINLKSEHQSSLAQADVDRIIRELAQSGWLSQTHNDWIIEPAYREAVARTAMLRDNQMGRKIIGALQRSQRLSDYVHPMGGHRSHHSPLRILRLQYLAQDTRYFFSNYSTVMRTGQWHSAWKEYVEELPQIFLPYDPEWVASLSAPLQTRTLEEVFFSDSFHQIDQERFLQQVLATKTLSDRQAFRLRTLAAHHLLFLHPPTLESWLPEHYFTYSEWEGLLAVRAVLAADPSAVGPHFNNFLKLNKLKHLPDNFFTCVYLLWYFRESQELNAPEIARILDKSPVKQYLVA